MLLATMMIPGMVLLVPSFLMAGAMILILPVLILFFLFQRQIVQSLATSGLKED